MFLQIIYETKYQHCDGENIGSYNKVNVDKTR